ncbi:hypothetical protein D9M68_328920 [compost metagenome]|uniref:Uncharacterized domain 1-containing protein n=1 Tax=Pseudomonas jinjuensis TaxID=198616 RepID=A0A1H0JF17_9PSED|nr:PaaI family thioesterase [Pseudomonas jinjuensis]SDO41941.1 uncharacterized domain 1-containing protein [Pseudomonas jinjuensis]
MNETPLLERVSGFLRVLRHCQLLGIEAVAAEPKGVTLRLPYSESIVGNPENGVIHGGAITTLMDTACGVSTLCVLPSPEVCPTIDLRVDYMRPAEPHKDVYGFAECYRVTRDVIFTRGFAYQDDPHKPVAHVVGTFMRIGKPISAAAFKTGGAA